MSLPRARALEQRRYPREPIALEVDHAVVMPAINRLRAAGELHRDVVEALDSVPPHLLPRVARFAGERHDMVAPGIMIMLLDRIGIDALAKEVGPDRAGNIFRRFRVTI